MMSGTRGNGRPTNMTVIIVSGYTSINAEDHEAVNIPEVLVKGS